MKILYYDCFSGISGDMNLGALIDLGVSFDYLKEELGKLGLDNEFKIEMTKEVKKGIYGTKIKVIDLNNEKKHKLYVRDNNSSVGYSLQENELHNHEQGDAQQDSEKCGHEDIKEYRHNHEHIHSHRVEDIHSEEKHSHHKINNNNLVKQRSIGFKIPTQKINNNLIKQKPIKAIVHLDSSLNMGHDEEHSHEHSHIHHKHSHSYHGHTHEHSHSHHGHSHSHSRNFGQIKELIQNSTLSSKVKEMSLDMFYKVAVAEGKIHNNPIEEVHFHEVGAIDSIVDIIGAAIGIDALNVDKVISSPVEVGYGTLKCAHGIMPVPAPATMEILKDIEIVSENVPFEATTPTGAAIIKSNAEEITYKKNFTIKKIGYGIGEKDNPNMANALRVILGETKEQGGKEYLLECNIDDMRPEEQEILMERLFKEKALDVFYNSVYMKKQRLGIKLSVIAGSGDKDKLKEIIFKNSSTIGIREVEINRTKLKREFKQVDSMFGKVPVKVSYYNGEVLRVKPEYDNCKEIAYRENISIDKVYNEILFNYNEKNKDDIKYNNVVYNERFNYNMR